MYKTSKKVTKDPKRVEAARKGREKYMNKLKERILNDAKKAEILPIQAMKLPAILPMQAMKLPALPTLPPPPLAPQDQMILISMVLLPLLSLPLVFVFFTYITLFSLKNSSVIAWRLSMSKNKINHKTTSYALTRG